MANPAFTETLIIDNDHYDTLVLTVRQKLATTGKFTHGRPILPREQNPPTRWFHVVLQIGTQGAAVSRTTLACRGDNVYVEGFRTNAGAWWEFGTQRVTTQLIPGSTFLGFGGGYVDLIGGADELVNINLGKEALRTAVGTLAAYNGGAQKDAAKRALVVVILMLSESFRFDSISKHLTTIWRAGGKIAGVMKEQVTRWEKISKALRAWDKDPTLKFPNLEPAEINNASQAAAVIYLVKDVDPDVLLLMDVAAPPAAMDGRPLVEVLAVRAGFDLRGTITVMDGRSAQCVYRRDGAGSVPVHDNQDTIMLCGPVRAISADVNFVIELDLNDEGKTSGEGEASKLKINWDGSQPTAEYNKPLSQTLDTSSGPVEVIYAVLSNAVEAIVQVKLVTPEGDDPINICGKLIAHCETFDVGSVLFSNDSNENVIVSSQQAIPLARSVVAAPLNSPLIIAADLYTSSMDEIVKGAIQFDPALSGEYVKHIAGTNAQIEVKITWLDHW